MRLQLKWKFPRKCSTECFKRCSVRYFPRQARAKLLVEKANGIKGASLPDKTISMNHSRNPWTLIFYYLHMLLVKRVRTLAATLKWKHRVAWNLSQQISKLPSRREFEQTCSWNSTTRRLRNNCTGHSSPTRIYYTSTRNGHSDCRYQT